LLVGAAESEPEHQINALIHDAEGYLSSESLDGVAKKEELPRPLPRMTKADLEADYKSLDRLLHRTLYLLVQVKEGYWKFPSANIKLTQEDLVSVGFPHSFSEQSSRHSNLLMCIGRQPSLTRVRRPEHEHLDRW
jgi:large subunit ribosomal protein L46